MRGDAVSADKPEPAEKIIAPDRPPIDKWFDGFYGRPSLSLYSGI